MEFYKFYKNEDISETNFSNWNVRDVIGHINSWIEFSTDKLESIKLKKSFEDISQVDIAIVNKTIYEKNKNKLLENVANESKIVLEKYKNILKLFSEEELLSNKFPTGFSFALWKYMAMDLGIHPIMHILYYYLKKKDYNEFISEIENSKKYFMEYSENNIREYYFCDYFENKMEIIERFNELKGINKSNNMIREIIEINLK
jgi:hypothetical protein